MTTAVHVTGDGDVYDRASEVKQFDASKTGVKGLVDSGLSSIPRFFVHPPETLPDLNRRPQLFHIIPTIDLAGDRPAIVQQISRASRELGLFQIVNHGIPVGVLDRVIASVKRFHEQPAEVKARFYRRHVGPGPGVCFVSNDSFNSNAACWRDSLRVRMGPELPEVEEIPEICRDEVVEWNRESKRVGEVLMGLLCEGLGLETSKLKETRCLEGRAMAGHYYPSCPQPHLTVGTNPHTDPGLLTILLQDHIGGLQIKHDDCWIDVEPLSGALIVNIGDALQVMSNDVYKSVEHRVLANPFPDPRVSVAIFFTPVDRDALYGPLREIISPEKPALFRHLNYNDYIGKFFGKHLDGKSLVNYYRL